MSDVAIIFGPGWGDPHIGIRTMVERFNEFDRVVLKYPSHGTRDNIKSLAGDKIAVCRALRERYDHLFYVGHSMGGLIGRSVAQQGEFEWDGYISIATPHHGTIFASKAPRILSKAFCPSIGDMIPDSSFLRHLDPPGKQTKVLTISAQFDPFLRPKDSARIANEEHITINRTDHLSVVLSKRTYYEIYAFILYEVLGRTEMPQGREYPIIVV